MTEQPKTLSRFAKYRDKTHLRVLQAMAQTSTKGLSASDWLRLARQKRYAPLKEALAKVIDFDTARPDRSLGQYFSYLRDKPFYDEELDGEESGPWMLRGKFFNGDKSYRHGVVWPGRAAKVAAIERDKARKESDAIAANVIAKQLRRGELDPDALAALTGAARVPSESIAERSVREAAEVSRNTCWTPPPTPARKAEPPPVPIDPEPAPPVDKSDWPPAWRKYGKPSYGTLVREMPDDSFKNFAPAAPSAAECGLPSPDIYPRSPLPK